MQAVLQFALFLSVPRRHKNNTARARGGGLWLMPLLSTTADSTRPRKASGKKPRTTERERERRIVLAQNTLLALSSPFSLSFSCCCFFFSSCSLVFYPSFFLSWPHRATEMAGHWRSKLPSLESEEADEEGSTRVRARRTSRTSDSTGR